VAECADGCELSPHRGDGRSQCARPNNARDEPAAGEVVDAPGGSRCPGRGMVWASQTLQPLTVRRHVRSPGCARIGRPANPVRRRSDHAAGQGGGVSHREGTARKANRADVVVPVACRSDLDACASSALSGAGAEATAPPALKGIVARTSREPELPADSEIAPRHRFKLHPAASRLRAWEA
jgi:hypothetical protein